jgi:hypothetical protein
MGYIDHRSAFQAATSLNDSGWTGSAQPVRTTFSALEWAVIALARNDQLSSLREPGPLARAVGGLFGLGRQSRLADPHLESLRRLAVYAWRHGFQLPVSEIKSFLAAGFTTDQLDLLLNSVSLKRATPRRRMAAA